MTVTSFISIRPVREAKRGAVGAAAFFVVPAAASSASGVENRTRASIVYCVDILPRLSLVLRVLKDLVLLFVDL